jgi:hypothetical protein
MKSDFNGDGKADVLWQNSSGARAIWLMNGTTYSSSVYFGIAAQWYLNNNMLISGAYSGTLPAGWSVAGVADFDGMGNSIMHFSTPARSNPTSGIYLEPV